MPETEIWLLLFDACSVAEEPPRIRKKIKVDNNPRGPAEGNMRMNEVQFIFPLSPSLDAIFADLFDGEKEYESFFH